MLAATLVVSSGVTLTNRSAFLIPASSRSRMDVGLPTIGRISMLEFVKFKRSSFGSIRIISCFSCDNIFARWVPTSPAPAIIIFILYNRLIIRIYYPLITIFFISPAILLASIPHSLYSSGIDPCSTNSSGTPIRFT